MSKPVAKPYNPLDTDSIGESLVRAMMSMDPVQIGSMTPFPGAGVYAIYYTGPFPSYHRIAAANAGGAFTQAIYVGKAVAPGSRKGTIAKGPVTGEYLYKRLREHRDSIVAASNLDVDDFYVRWLVVEPIWIPLTETLMINRSACVWNGLVDGFGMHAPGKHRAAGERSMWDTLHPGRPWEAAATPNAKWTAATVAQEVTTWIDQRI